MEATVQGSATACESNNVEYICKRLSCSLPWFLAAPIWTLFIEINCTTQDGCSIWMSLTFDGQPVVNMPAMFEEVKEFIPQLSAFASIKKRLGIPNQDQGITRPGEENIQTLG